MEISKSQRGYSIGELASLTGVHFETIRYYERIGIMPRPDRLANGYRQFNHDHLKRLNFIHKCRDLGFSLKKVEKLLGMVDHNDLTCGEIHEITLEHLTEVNAKLSRLRKLKNVLKSMSNECSQGEVPECPVIDALFEAA
jgi:MerR family transcriptional regulator, mercuric resistance operon regulatory protein